MHPDFPQRLHELVERAKEIRKKGIHGVDPEEYTKQHLIEPFLTALAYDRDDIRKEFHILGDQCDYLLETRRPLLFVEAKSFLDKIKRSFRRASRTSSPLFAQLPRQSRASGDGETGDVAPSHELCSASSHSRQ
jgi:hypothetical protein